MGRGRCLAVEFIRCSLVLLLTCLVVFPCCVVCTPCVCFSCCLSRSGCLLRCGVWQWEATYFDVSHSATVDCAKAAAQAGIEMIVIDDGCVWWRVDSGRVQQAFHPICTRCESRRGACAVHLLTALVWYGCAPCHDLVCMLRACSSLCVCTDGSRTVWMPSRDWEIGRWTRRSFPLAWRHWHGTSMRRGFISGYVCCRSAAGRCMAFTSGERLLVIFWRASLSCTPSWVLFHSCTLFVCLHFALQVTD